MNLLSTQLTSLTELLSLILTKRAGENPLTPKLLGWGRASQSPSLSPLFPSWLALAGSAWTSGAGPGPPGEQWERKERKPSLK